jgi:hypothetical protein
MKRLNPDTGNAFKCGDVRKDGKIFKSYITSKPINKDGYYYEHWEEEKTFYLNKTKRKINSKNHALMDRGRALQMVRSCKKSAKRRNIVFNISIEDVLPGVQSKNCQLTGIPFNLKPPEKKAMNLYAPSIDRIDNNKGYTKDNIRIVLWAVNRAVGEDGDEVMLPILKEMIKAIEKNAKQNTATPVPTSPHLGGEVYPELGPISTPGARENSHDIDHYQRAVRGDDADYRAQARGGDGVGYGSEKVGPPKEPKGSQDNGDAETKTGGPTFASRHLFG